MTTKNVWLGFLAGFAGGILGGLVKMGCEGAVPPRPEGREQPPWILAKRTWHAWTGDELADDKEKPVTLAIHFGFSAFGAGAYGALAEYVPAVTAGAGTLHGIANWIGAHEIALPALALTPPLSGVSASEQVNEAISHAIWGLTVELVRAPLRGTPV